MDNYLQRYGTEKQSKTSSNLVGDYLDKYSGKPDDVVKANQYVGNPTMNQHQGLCQQFVEQVTVGKTGLYPSAIDAFVKQMDKAQPGLEGVKPGDVVYFSPNDSNEGYGHTGIYEGNNRFISATDNGVMPYDISEWEKLTGQTPLGYIPKERIQ